MTSELSGEQLGEALRDLVVEKLAEKAAQKDRATAKSRLHAEALDLLANRVSALDLWTRIPPSGRRPRLSRDDLAVAAVRIADAEGMDALSMRRLAAELEVATMSLYHYVRTKDELLTVVMDAVMGEVVVPRDTTIPRNWRKALTLIARRTKATVERHPWILDLVDDPPIGPNSVRHFDQSLQAVAGLDLPLPEKLDIVTVIDEYVFGYCLGRRGSHGHDSEGPQADDMVAYVSVLIETGAYPQLAKLADEAGLQTLWKDVWDTMGDDKRFERNLARILDGIEQDIGTTRRR